MKHYSMKHNVLGLSIATLISTSQAVSAETIFQDNFESYSPGGNLIGQNGWTDEYGGVYTIIISSGAYMPTQVANGRNPIGNIHTAIHQLPRTLNPSETAVLTFDGYGTSSFPPSTNSGVGLVAGPGLSNPIGGVWWDINNDSGGWSFDARGITGDFSDLSKRYTISGYYDEIGHFRIILDGINNEVYGTATFGLNTIETPHFSVTGAAIGSLTKVMMFQDYQINHDRLGAEFDNISVTAVPEPTELSLFVIGLGLLYGRVRNRLRHA